MRDQEDVKEFYRKTLHSPQLCDDKDCDICNPAQKCGFVEVTYPVDTIGNNKIWHCLCGTTACLNQ